MKEYLIVSITVEEDGNVQIENDIVEEVNKHEALKKYHSDGEHKQSMVVNIVCLSD